MEILPLIISAISVIMCILTFVFNRRDKAVKDTKEIVDTESDRKVIEYRLNELTDKVNKILEKLDNQEEKIENIVKKEIEKHELKYHKNERK